MRAYIIRRLLLAIPTLFIVTLIVFFLIRLVPGDVVDAIAVQLVRTGADVKAARAQIVRDLGLDVPMLQQYARWVGVVRDKDGNLSGIFQGDFGESFFRPASVLELIGKRWPVTLELSLMGLIISQLIALPIGTYSAIRQDTAGDYIGRSFAILAIAVPSFWIGTLVVLFPALWWGYMIPIMHVPFIEDPLRNLRMFIVPATILGLAMSGGTMRLTRTMVLEVTRQDYIRTAWAKGLRERVVIIRHTLKNALIPVITYIGLWVPILLGGTAIIEVIFVLPGMGSLVVDSIVARDYPVISGVMLFMGAGLVLINLLIDLTYGFLDPRIHFK